MRSPANDNPNYMIPNYFRNPVLRPYLANVRNWQCYIRFLGLPDRRDNPDIIIDRLFVVPLLARRYVSPDENPKSWAGEAETLLDVLAENSPLMLLGDPGIGKSTFLNYVAWLLSRPAENALIDRMGWRLPLPMVLRELPVRGVTDFDGLLEAFLGREMSAPLREDGGRYLRQALADGQAFLLLDGIDELGDREARENLRSAVFDGMLRYPDCRWLLTSRIVGYDEVPFDSAHRPRNESPFPEEPDGGLRDTIPHRRPRGLLPMRPESRGGQLPVRYIAPFDDRRIAAFARNWYVRREASASRASANADHLVRAVHADESILRLARVPNLLTMMALIHRIEATLPHGRALLYERIAEAYLESIDKFRGIESSPHDLPRKKGWLARVGFEMQRRRIEEGRPNETNILVDAATVREWLSEEMGRSDALSDTPSAEEFLKVTGRRSGLFLPRGEGRYAFVHLSFQEYFAAVALKREVTRLRWAKGNASRLGFDRDTLADWAAQSLWRETFAFLFELLASEEDDDWHADLLNRVFGEEFSRLNEQDPDQDEQALNLGHLLARLVINSRSGLTSKKRDNAITNCVSTQLRISSRTPWPNIFSVLLGDDVQLNEDVFGKIKAQMNKSEIWTLDLSDVRISDISSLAKFTELQSLVLTGTHVSDLSPIKDLTSLHSLNLIGTLVSDLSPLINLSALQSLYIFDTQVTNLDPIANLSTLQSLALEAIQTSDLAFLENLTELQSLILIGGENSHLQSLSRLSALQNLELVDLEVSDISPLAGLTTLRSLEGFGVAISDLSPLANLPVLESLHLEGSCVSDLSPLANFTSICSLQLYEGEFSDISPLADVSTLHMLGLSFKAPLDLTPLANLPMLHELNLYSASPLELEPLAGLTSLRRLNLGRVKGSAEAVEKLRASRPDLQITAWTEDAEDK